MFSLNNVLAKRLRYNFALLKFKLPDLGEKIKEATVKSWLVKEGSKVTEF